MLEYYRHRNVHNRSSDCVVERSRWHERFTSLGALPELQKARLSPISTVAHELKKEENIRLSAATEWGRSPLCRLRYIIQTPVRCVLSAHFSPSTQRVVPGIRNDLSHFRQQRRIVLERDCRR